MKEAQFQYKCRMCGKIDTSLCCGIDYAQHRLIECLIRGRSCHKDIPVTMINSHICADGSFGVTDLIGYKIVGQK